MKPNIRPISRIEPLTEAQREQLVQWADEMSYEKAAERANQEWGCEIPKNSVARFYLRTLPARFLPDTPDTAQAAAEIVQYAVTGQPKFAEATMVVLERTAFELALACAHKDEHMQALKDVSTMLCRYRNASVRERMAKVQETKCDLRKEEVDLKKSKQARSADIPVRPPAAPHPLKSLEGMQAHEIIRHFRPKQPQPKPTPSVTAGQPAFNQNQNSTT